MNDLNETNITHIEKINELTCNDELSVERRFGEASHNKETSDPTKKGMLLEKEDLGEVASLPGHYTHIHSGTNSIDDDDEQNNWERENLGINFSLHTERSGGQDLTGYNKELKRKRFDIPELDKTHTEPHKITSTIT